MPFPNAHGYVTDTSPIRGGKVKTQKLSTRKAGREHSSNIQLRSNPSIQKSKHPQRNA